MIDLEFIKPKINIDFQKTRRIYYICSNKEKGIRYLCKQVGYDMQGNIREYIEYYEWGEIKEKHIYDYCEHGIVSVWGKEDGINYFEEYIYGANNLPERKISLSRFVFKLDAIEEIPGLKDSLDKENTSISITEYSYDEFGRIINETITSYYPDGKSQTISRHQNKYFDSTENVVRYSTVQDNSKQFKEIILFSPDNKIKIKNIYCSDGRLHSTECTSYEENGSITHSCEVFDPAVAIRYISIYDPNGNLIDDTEYNDYDEMLCKRKIFEYDDITNLLKFCREIITEKDEVSEDNFWEYEVVFEDRI